MGVYLVNSRRMNSKNWIFMHEVYVRGECPIEVPFITHRPAHLGHPGRYRDRRGTDRDLSAPCHGGH